MRTKRIKVFGARACYHCMTRTVNGALLFRDREKEVLRKMLWQVADFSGVRVLTYCILSNHFHVLLEVPVIGKISDRELLRRYRVLYPKPTRYQEASIKVLERLLAAGGEQAETVRRQLLERMGDVSEFMKTLKQRFTIWFNKSHERYGPLWADRFKSVLVEGEGNPLQTMAAYIDLNPVRAALVEDPKDYRFCGYAEAVAGNRQMRRALMQVHGGSRGNRSRADALNSHREWIFGKGGDPRQRQGRVIDPKRVRQVLEKENGILPSSQVMRCRVRYFTDGLILGSEEYVRGFSESVRERLYRKRAPAPSHLTGADWGDITVLRSLRKQVFF